MRDFAVRLIAYETENTSPESRISGVFPVYEKLRPQLATLMGNAGVRALFLRALARASKDALWLTAVRTKADGAIEGLDNFATQVTPEDFFEGRVALLAQLLELLVAFIGESLTQRLVREVWPEVSLDDLHVGI